MQSALCGHTDTCLLCVGAKCLVMSWSWSLGRLTGPCPGTGTGCTFAKPLYSRHGRTPAGMLPSLPVSSPHLLSSLFYIHTIFIERKHTCRSADILLRSVLFLNKSIMNFHKQTNNSWSDSLYGRGRVGVALVPKNCAAYAYLATMSSLSVIVTGVSNRLTTSNRIYFHLPSLSSTSYPSSFHSPHNANGTRHKCQSVSASLTTTLFGIPYGKQVPSPFFFLYEMPGISISIS